MKALSVVVPCYSEEKNIPLIVERFEKILPNNLDVELILVNNGSVDNSSNVMNKLSKQKKFLKVVTIKKNIGYGNGIWQGIMNAKGEFICWTHADMQTDLADTIKALRIIKKQKNQKKCFVKGRRRKRPLFDAFFTFGMSAFESVYLGKILYDINAQPNLFHKDLLKKIKNPPKDFSFDLYFYYIAKKLGYKIVRFPVYFKKRIHGSSSWNTGLAAKWKFIKRTIDFTVKMKRS